MAAVTICSDFGDPRNKVSHCFHCFPISSYLPHTIVKTPRFSTPPPCPSLFSLTGLSYHTFSSSCSQSKLLIIQIHESLISEKPETVRGMVLKSCYIWSFWLILKSWRRRKGQSSRNKFWEEQHRTCPTSYQTKAQDKSNSNSLVLARGQRNCSVNHRWESRLLHGGGGITS